jgi:hypothetical protein
MLPALLLKRGRGRFADVGFEARTSAKHRQPFILHDERLPIARHKQTRY